MTEKPAAQPRPTVGTRYSSRADFQARGRSPEGPLVAWKLIQDGTIQGPNNRRRVELWLRT